MLFSEGSGSSRTGSTPVTRTIHKNSSVLKTNDSLKYDILTKITRIIKEVIFQD